MELILNSSFSFFALLCIYLFFTILFLQSGLDKIFNWNTELNWIKEHFSKTIFRSKVFFPIQPKWRGGKGFTKCQYQNAI